MSTQLARDADLEVDDNVTVVIDPFLDHRNGFSFEEERSLLGEGELVAGEVDLFLVADCHVASHVESTVRPLSATRPSAWAPSGFVAK